MTDGPFPGFSPAFTGYATFTGLDLNTIPNNNIPAVAPVPVPAAAWLFASGLLGLSSIARRNRAKAA